MARAIGYYTNCNQGQELVNRFGEYDLNGLTQIDQAAMIVALGGFTLATAVGIDADGDDMALSLNEAVDEFVSENYLYVSDDFVEAIEILNGINSDDAIRIIQFLVQ